MLKPLSLLLIGCGNLGSSFLTCWQTLSFFNNIIVVQPSLGFKATFANIDFITFVANASDIPTDFTADVVVLAIKPQQIDDVLPDYIDHLKNQLLLSLMAKIPIKTLARYCDANTRIVRVMATIAASIGRGINLVYSGSLNKNDQQYLEQLLMPTGTIIPLDNEKLIDQLTPILGSGPAYFYLLAEILRQFMTTKLAISDELAKQLSQQLLLGSGLLAKDNLTADFNILIKQVASKGGITEKILQTLTPVWRSSFFEALNENCH